MYDGAVGAIGIKGGKPFPFAAARAVLHAEGSVPREAAAAGWDSYTWDLSDGRTLESYLSWPETEIMLKEAGGAGHRPGS